MKFHPTPLADARLIEQEPRADERGFFARAYCADAFAAQGITSRFVQMNMSGNNRRGTMRGLHYQAEPAPEAKLLRCIRGAVYDVMVDMRPDSPTYLKHFGVELTEENRLAVYVPPLFAHGYLALTDGAHVLYQVSSPYTPDAERGVRYDDPALRIGWPIEVSDVSAKDRAWPTLREQGLIS